MREHTLRESAPRQPTPRQPVLAQQALGQPALRQPALRQPALRQPALRQTVRRGDRGWSAPARRSGLMLAAQANSLLHEAAAESYADERFRTAHLAALRTAAALFADRARPATRGRPTNAWVLLDALAPEFADWAAFFADGASKRAAIEAGARHVVTAREADDLVRAVSEFLSMVQVSLGVIGRSRAS